ncbi:glycosyltransferase family 39 protein [soil metagenome]
MPVTAWMASRLRGDAPTASPSDSANSIAPAREFLGVHWSIILVLAAFFAVAFWVPVMTPVATTDDWGYSRSVEILLDEGHLEVFPVVAATAVFQIVWGSLFALVIDNTLGAVRLSTLVIVGVSGAALYDICRRIGVPASRAALAVAAYLFNPLSFVLSYSFMTDPHFAAMMIIATALTLRGIEPGEHPRVRWLIAGSVAAAAAILIRQQGVLIPLSVAVFLALRGDIQRSRDGFRHLCVVGLIPAMTTLLYLMWLRWFNGVPDVQSEFASEIGDAGIGGSLRLISTLTYFELMYAGFFVLPITAAALIGFPPLRRRIKGYAWLLAIGWAIAACAGLVYFADTNRRMPYVPQFMGSGGLGPPDVRGSRPRLFEQPFFDLLTALSFISVMLLGFVLARGLSERPAGVRNGAGLVVAVLAGQIVGVIPPSYHYLNRGYSLDRYLLPILPLIIALALWALRDSRFVLCIGWAMVALFGLFAAAGTRDYLHYMDATWSVAAYAIESGARPDQVDAGAAWVGYHLYTYGVDENIDRARTRDGPWWTYFYGKATDSSYVVAGRWMRGYVLVTAVPYPSLLQSERTVLLLLRRPEAPWPPEPANE